MWLTTAILSYFILAIVFLVDKYLLVSSIPNPKVYAFYVGALGGLAIVLAPFVDFFIPGPNQIVLGIFAGASFVFGLFWFYKALATFEASRVVPAVGGLVPLFTFTFIFFLSGGGEFSLTIFTAFFLLVLGSVLMTIEKGKLVNFNSLKISLFAAFLFSVSIVLSKYLYSELPFWTGFIWRSLGGTLAAICFFVIFPEIKKEVFKKQEKKTKKPVFVFLGNQVISAVANILQNWSIYLAPLLYVAFINALQGVQYVFLLIFSIILSLKFPGFVKEEISKKTILWKILAILAIAGGLAILAFLDKT
jgi:drug/metabolite transporter (DMT)-like permease